MEHYLEFCGQIERYPVVVWFTNSLLASILIWLSHYFSLFLTIGSMVVLDLRVLGVAGRKQTITQIANVYSRWMWTGLAVLFVSGTMMAAGDSVLFCTNGVFGTKLVLIVLAATSGVIIQRSARRWDQAPTVPTAAKALALVSLILWVGTILAAVEIPALTNVP
jgi:uncharacterized protein DUF6644